MHISNIYRAPQMGYLEGKGGRYVSQRSISEAKSLMFVLRRPTMSSPTCVSPSWAGRRRSGPSSRWGLWARASPSGISRGSSTVQCHYHEVCHILTCCQFSIARLSTMSCDVNWTKAKDDRITNWYWNKQASHGTLITLFHSCLT